MLSALTHMAVNYSYTLTPATPEQTAGVFGMLLVFWLIAMAFGIIVVVALWRVFAKAGQPGWAAIIPLYNSWVLAEVAGKPGWWGLYPLLAFVPVVGWIAIIAVSLMLALGVSKNFGKSDAFGVLGLWIFSVVGYLILGFGSASYKAVSSPAAPAPSAPTAM